MLPPLPASWQPTGARGQSLADENARVFSVRSAKGAGGLTPGLSLELRTNVWRPNFYDQLTDWEFQPTRQGGQARIDMMGIAGTRPGVTGYTIEAENCWASQDAKPSGAVDEGAHILKLSLRQGQSCQLALTSVNTAYPSGFSDFLQPQAMVNLRRLVGRSADAMISATLKGVDLHFYQFTAVPGKTVKFCTVLNGDGDCEDRGAKVAGKDTVIEVWGPDGRLDEATDGRDGESQVEWTPSPGEGGVYHLLVRGGYLCGDVMPCGGSYILKYTVPSWPAGLPLNPFANLTVTKLSPRSAVLDWRQDKAAMAAQSGEQAATPETGYYYEVRKNGITVLMPGLKPGSTSPLQVKERRYSFTKLTPGTVYTFGARLAGC